MPKDKPPCRLDKSCRIDNKRASDDVKRAASSIKDATQKKRKKK